MWNGLTMMLVDLANEHSKVMVVGEDFDLLTLPISNTTTTFDNIIFMKPAINNVQMRLYEIQTNHSEIHELQWCMVFAQVLDGLVVRMLAFNNLGSNSNWGMEF